MVAIGRPGSGGSSSGFKLDDHIGHSVAFVNNDEQTDVQTRHGVVDRVASSEYVVCLTDNAVFRNHMTFGKAMVPAILDGTENIVLGTIGKGDASGGKNAAWLLFDPTDEEVTAAVEWFGKYSAALPSGRVVIDTNDLPEPPGANESF